MLKNGLVLFSSPGQIRKWNIDKVQGYVLIFEKAFLASFLSDPGFIDTSYFIRDFKAETGETPLAFRKNQNP